MLRHGGTVPDTMEALTALPGVGRKTANVVLANAFHVPAIAVDTHVFRVSNRTGLATAKTVEGTEEQLMRVIPKADWIAAHHWLIFHGRRVCHARKPDCAACALLPDCRYGKGLTAGLAPEDSKVKTARAKPASLGEQGTSTAAKPARRKRADAEGTK